MTTSEAAIPSVFPRVPEEARPQEASAQAPPIEASDGAERSAWLVALGGQHDWRASARRVGWGLAMMLPFTLAAGLRSRHTLTESLVAAVTFPVGVALVALVGVAASTLGVTLVSAPLSPEQGASLASHAIFRTGVLLFGLAPVTALWVAGGRWLEGALASTFAAMVAGLVGIVSVSAGIVRATADERGHARLGAWMVAFAFGGFALLLGARTWLAAGLVLLGGPS